MARDVRTAVICLSYVVGFETNFTHYMYVFGVRALWQIASIAVTSALLAAVHADIKLRVEHSEY